MLLYDVSIVHLGVLAVCCMTKGCNHVENQDEVFTTGFDTFGHTASQILRSTRNFILALASGTQATSLNDLLSRNLYSLSTQSSVSDPRCHESTGGWKG